jgi:PadR family transcriptional regulator PadR
VKGGIDMDIQMKRGLLDVCVLAAIKDDESYGYRIIKDIKPYLDISESTLYPILRRLEAAELLTVRTAEHDGRLRKYYKITKQGLKRIEDFKEEWKEIMSIYKFVVKEDNAND